MFRSSTRRACRLMQLSHSVWYYKPHARDDSWLRKRIREIAEVRVRYGFWRIYILLKRKGFTNNHKRVYRVYKEEGLNLRSKDLDATKRGHTAWSGQSSLLFINVGVWILLRISCLMVVGSGL